ncbi:hypothetical protein D051_5707 [Vibrio parahaemolyticus VPCR-2010]|nr:hypothetical protein A79_3185 [Vibrio parahaemolyticus AQ3810]EQL84019.1 hypothetical protein D019_2895 [Vibrio parahaemolyticus VP2007-095]EQM44428.1 hypothetical protein D042_4209 [Vibrio parahaemolyticus NIHCB0757]EQM50477.1 hypothetical protein D051_5707 [Vibrio parahaemolyticus VPCR-2010]ETJ91954.1 hypothetical protein D029_0854 [Vibrio parahaemolyticus 970107]ETJ96619.1 hypothetical protein D041_0375 [Vibrio parahaemolyticus EKP-008]EXJ33962.1 hypothetical protein D050_2581 [Vibrio p
MRSGSESDNAGAENSGNIDAKPSKNCLIKLLPLLVSLAKTIHQSTSN